MGLISKYLTRPLIRLMIKMQGQDNFNKEFIDHLLRYYGLDKYSKEEGNQYKNAEEETDATVKMLPELLPIRGQLIAIYRELRIKSGLNP
jgi:hypothetical protein